MSLKEYGIICENEPTYTKAEELIVVQFRNIFLKIKNMGFVKSHRSNNTGIGKTFEDLVGVQENNLQDADFMNFIEIKSKRKKSNSMLTLFTKSPEYPKDSNTYLREKYGMTDDGTGQKLLHTTITATEFNQFGDKYGFKLECDDTGEKLLILIQDRVTHEIIEHNIFYTYETLRKIVSKKCANIAYITADTRKNNDGTEEFKYISAELLSGCTFEKFLNAIKIGVIKYDIRIGYYKSGPSLGKRHDHGSGFRIKKDDIHHLFLVTNIT